MFKQVIFGLLLIVTISHSIALLPEAFDRPWETIYKWPGNESVVSYTFSPLLHPGWNVYVLQPTLNNLAITTVDPRYRDSNYSQCVANYHRASAIMAQVDEFTNYGILPYLFNDTNIINTIANIINDICMMKFGGVACAPYPTLGALLGCNADICKELRYIWATRLLFTDYDIAWKATMNCGLAMLENRAHMLNSKLAHIAAELNECEYEGICNQDVAGSAICAQAANYLEGNSNNFRKIRNALFYNSIHVYDAVPSVEFGWVMNAIGNNESGELAVASNIAAALAKHRREVAVTYSMLSKQAKDQLRTAENAKKSAYTHELWRIRASPYFGTVISGQVSSINSSLGAADSNLNAAKAEIENAEFTYILGMQGYLRDALASMTNAKTFALLAMNEYSKAENGAKEVVADYRQRAVESISKLEKKYENGVWPSRVAMLRDSAKAALAKGDKETVLGLKFEFYAAAQEDAERAYKVSPQSEADMNASALAICMRAHRVVDAAKADGIDVSYEKALLSIVEKSSNASELAAGCEAAFDGVVASAKQRYGYLDEKRVSILSKLVKCGADCDDLKRIMEEREVGLVSGGHIVYPDAIGSLSSLAETYARIEAGIADSMKSQVARFIYAKPHFYLDWAGLDMESTTTLKVEITNPVDYPGKELVVVVPSPMEFSELDAVEVYPELKAVVYKDGKLSLYLREIGARSTKTYSFSRNRILLRTEHVNKHAVGLEDGSARVQEERIVWADADIRGFRYSGDWESLRIDGIVAALSNGYVPFALREGKHVLNITYHIPDAYFRSIVMNTSTAVGNRVYYSYQVAITPVIDLESVDTFATVPFDQNIQEVKVTTISGEKIISTAVPGGFAVRIYNVGRGRVAKFQVSYHIDNVSLLIENAYAKLSAQNVSNTTIAILEQARGLMRLNNISGAVAKVQEAYELAATEASMNNKLNAERAKYLAKVQSELNKITSVLSDNSSNDLQPILSARKKVLEQLLSSLEGKNLSDQVSVLRNYDASWLHAKLREFRKNASSEIARLYSYYLAGGKEDIDTSTAFSEARTAYARFDASASIEDAWELAKWLEIVRQKTSILQASEAAELSNLRAACQETLDKSNVIFKHYVHERNAAQNTRFEGLFPRDMNIDAIVRDANAALRKNNMSMIQKECSKLSNATLNVSNVLSYLSDTAKKNTRSAAAAVKAASGRLSEKDIKKIGALLDAANASLDREEWVNALKNADEIVKIVDNARTDWNYDTVLLATALFIIAVAVFYFYKGQQGIGPLWGKKPERQLRRLEKAT